MLCKKCGAYVNDEDILCPNCGSLLDKHEQVSGVQAIRQGRRQSPQTGVAQKEKAPTPRRRSGASRPEETGRVYVDPLLSGGASPEARAPYTFSQGVEENTEGGMERRSRRVYGTERTQPQLKGVHAPKRRKGVHKVSNHMVNWARLAIVAVVLVIGLMVGAYFYITRTPTGQRILARMGRDTTATALWEVGEEALDVGDIDGAIADFEKARAQDGEDNVNVDGLLLLGPNKDEKSMTPAEDRFHMCELAVKADPRLRVSRVEIDSDERSFTYRTLHKK